MEYKSEKQKIALQKQGQYLQKFNLENVKIKPEDEQKVIDLYLSGKSCNEIKFLFNCSKPTILKVLKHIPKRKATDYNQHPCRNQFGDKNPCWKGGTKSVYDRIRNLNEYWNWRKSVLDRDNNCCTKCKSTDKLHAHHIRTLKSLITSYSNKYKKLPKEFTNLDLTNSYFYDINNGLTLCEFCHKKWHKENGR